MNTTDAAALNSQLDALIIPGSTFDLIFNRNQIRGSTAVNGFAGCTVNGSLLNGTIVYDNIRYPVLDYRKILDHSNAEPENTPVLALLFEPDYQTAHRLAMQIKQLRKKNSCALPGGKYSVKKAALTVPATIFRKKLPTRHFKPLPEHLKDPFKNRGLLAVRFTEDKIQYLIDLFLFTGYHCSAVYGKGGNA